MRKRVSVVVLLITILGATMVIHSLPNSTRTAKAASPFVSMAFAIGWQMPTTPAWGNINQEDLFALQTENGTGLDTSFIEGNGVNPQAFTAAAHAHNVQALITIGGSSDQNWQNACDSTNQAGFVSNLVSYMLTNGFDGINLDIEDDVFASQGPPSAEMTSCIEAISTAAKAVTTQQGGVPLITADVITNWEGPWFAPSQSYVDQFDLMTYGDTCNPNCSTFQSDVTDTQNQGLPLAKMVIGIDVIDDPSESPDCGNDASYASTSGLLGAFVWDELTDENNNYQCLGGIGPFMSGGGSGNPTPTPTTQLPTPTATPIPPTPTPTPPPSAAFVQAKTSTHFSAGRGPVSGAYASNVLSGNTLVALAEMGGGNDITNVTVSDTLANVWVVKTSAANGDGTVVVGAYTTAKSSGADTVTVHYSVDGSGYCQVILTVSEFSGVGAFVGESDSGTGGTSHSSGAVTASAGDVVISGYSDAGYSVGITKPSAQTSMGTNEDNSVNEEGDQSYTLNASANPSSVFTTSASAQGVVEELVFA